MTRLKTSGRWKSPVGALSDIPADVGCYQDDIFLWGDNTAHLSHNVGLLAEALGAIGLQLAQEKTSVVCSKYYKGVRFIDIAGCRVEFQPPGSSMRVLGLDFDLDAPAHQQAKEIMGRVWSAFHANKPFLCGPGSRSEKADLICKLVEGCWSWCAGGLHWEKDDLASMNSSFGCKRLEGECWPDYNARSLREMRLWLQQSGRERWSTKVLRLQFQLVGHWVRRWEGDHKSLPAALMGWRDLAWWQQQQSLSPAAGGARHPRRFRAANTERSLASCLGVCWQSACWNRDGWRQLLPLWLRSEDVPWCRGRQPALML